jgi:hypothetical protein
MDVLQHEICYVSQDDVSVGKIDHILGTQMGDHEYEHVNESTSDA